MAANFTWSDEEINLLLHVVIDYKAGKSGEGVDWETVRSKNEDMTKLFLEKYPENDKEKFPRRTEASESFNKDRIQNELKFNKMQQTRDKMLHFLLRSQAKHN